MKVLALILTFGLMFSAFAMDSVTLDKAQINIGAIAQDESTSAFEEIIIVRTAATPKKVVLAYNFSFADSFCSQWEQRQICYPGQPTTICHAGPVGPICEVIYVPGRCDFERYCVRYETRVLNNSQEMTLDFGLANDLKESQSEQFKLTLKQNGFNSDNVKYSAETIAADVEYVISGRGPFAKRGLFFKVQE